MDQVLAEKIGNSNTGNVARRFFKDPVKAAEITGSDEELIIVGFMLSSYFCKVVKR